MKNKDIKKLQQAGYSNRPFKDIRHKIKTIDIDEEVNHRSLKRKKVCRFNKGVHNFVKVKESNFLQFSWVHYQCEFCGKQKFK